MSKASKPKAKKIKVDTPATPKQTSSADAIGSVASSVDSAGDSVAPTNAVRQPNAILTPKDHRNGITRPGPGKCLDVWTHLDALRASGEKVTFEALRLRIDPSTAAATLRTQWARWRKYNA